MGVERSCVFSVNQSESESNLFKSRGWSRELESNMYQVIDGIGRWSQMIVKWGSNRCGSRSQESKSNNVGSWSWFRELESKRNSDSASLVSRKFTDANIKINSYILVRKFHSIAQFRLFS